MTCSLVISERSRIVKAGLHLPGCVAGRQKTALAKLITDQKRETWYGEKYAMEQETEVCSMGFFGGGEAFFALGRWIVDKRWGNLSTMSCAGGNHAGNGAVGIVNDIDRVKTYIASGFINVAGCDEFCAF